MLRQRLLQEMMESELDEGTTVIIRMPKVEENAAAGWEKV